MPRIFYNAPVEVNIGQISPLVALYNQNNNISQDPVISAGIGDIVIPAFQFYQGVLTSLSGVEYEWLGLPPGIEVADSSRLVIEGIPTVPGVYPILLRVTNERGAEIIDNFNITVDPPYDQFSVNFNNNQYTDATADTNNPLYAAGPSGPAWTISAWFKAGTSNNTEQTILSFGGASQANDGRVQLWMHGGQDRFTFRYGTNGRFVEKQFDDTLFDEEWNHLLVTYDGGITGGNIGDNPDSVYLGAFSIRINNVIAVPDTENVGSGGGLEGWPNGTVDGFFRFGRNCDAGNYLQNDSRIGEVALWSLDAETVSGLTDAIYGSGVGHDLSLISDPPDHWWRMGDGDTFPTLADSGDVGGRPMTMTGMAAIDIVQDAPAL